MSTTKSSSGGSSSSTVRDLVAGAILGVALTTTAAIAASRLARSSRERRRRSGDGDDGDRRRRRDLPASFRAELLSRTSLFFGEDAAVMERTIRRARVLVVGCGGVGSHCVMSLARSGVRALRIVDMDVVTLSSLNRHACATLDDVGSPKVEVLKKRTREVLGDGDGACEVDARCEMFTADRCDLLDVDDDDEPWDYVVDAIDDVPTKTALLAECYRRRVPVVSCMGAAGKADPTRLHLGDLNGASRDPLASKLRHRLRRIDPAIIATDENYQDPVTVLYSSEQPSAGPADLTEEQRTEGPHKFGAVDDMRVRVLPVLGTMPAIMGHACAARVLTEIAGKPISPVSGERLGKNVRHRALQHLKNRETRLRREIEDASNGESSTTPAPWVGPVQVDSNDVEFLISTVWRQRCAVTGAKLGTVLELVRWDMSRPSSADNLVLVDQGSLNKFDACGRDGEKAFGDQIARKVERRLRSFPTND